MNINYEFKVNEINQIINLQIRQLILLHLFFQIIK